MALKSMMLFATELVSYKSKNGITYIFSHYFAKIKVDSYDSLSIEKILSLHNVVILIKTVLSKDKNYYYYKMFFKKMFVSIS